MVVQQFSLCNYEFRLDVIFLYYSNLYLFNVLHCVQYTLTFTYQLLVPHIQTLLLITKYIVRYYLTYNEIFNKVFTSSKVINILIYDNYEYYNKIYNAKKQLNHRVFTGVINLLSVQTVSYHPHGINGATTKATKSIETNRPPIRPRCPQN